MKEFKSLNGYTVKDETARNIAKGKNQAVAFGNYSTMITALKALSKDEYKVGQNIYIGTVGVPDLWVYSVESILNNYEYTTDEAFVNMLDANTTVQVGYYKLSMLEGQKVDLTEYEKTKDADEKISAIQKTVDELNSEIKSKLSHVGMIIHSTTLDTMAKVIAVYGGTTWKKIEGRFLLGQSSSYAVNSTGGEATHTLTEGEMPAHEHSLKWLGFNDEQTGNTNVYAFSSYGMFRGINLGTYQTGNNKPHNNMPPYKTVYIWERTA